MSQAHFLAHYHEYGKLTGAYYTSEERRQHKEMPNDLFEKGVDSASLYMERKEFNLYAHYARITNEGVTLKYFRRCHFGSWNGLSLTAEECNALENVLTTWTSEHEKYAGFIASGQAMIGHICNRFYPPYAKEPSLVIYYRKELFSGKKGTILATGDEYQRKDCPTTGKKQIGNSQWELHLEEHIENDLSGECLNSGDLLATLHRFEITLEKGRTATEPRRRDFSDEKEKEHAYKTRQAVVIEQHHVPFVLEVLQIWKEEYRDNPYMFK